MRCQLPDHRRLQNEAGLSRCVPRRMCSICEAMPAMVCTCADEIEKACRVVRRQLTSGRPLAAASSRLVCCRACLRLSAVVLCRCRLCCYTKVGSGGNARGREGAGWLGSVWARYGQHPVEACAISYALKRLYVHASVLSICRVCRTCASMCWKKLLRKHW